MSATQIKREMDLLQSDIKKYKNILNQYYDLQSKIKTFSEEKDSEYKKISKAGDSLSNGGYVSNPDIISPKINELKDMFYSINMNIIDIKKEIEKKISDYNEKISDLSNKYSELDKKYTGLIKK